jgi:hypothetical protein
MFGGKGLPPGGIDFQRDDDTLVEATSLRRTCVGGATGRLSRMAGFR